MLDILLLLLALCVTAENSALDFKLNDQDVYECFFIDEIEPQKLLTYEPLKPCYSQIYKATDCTGEVLNRLNLPLKQYHYDPSIERIDGFIFDYVTSFRSSGSRTPDVIYLDYIDTAHSRLTRFYSLLGHEIHEHCKTVGFYTYNLAPFNSKLESMIDAAKWECGSYSCLKIMMDAFLDDPKNIIFAGMLKNASLYAQIPFIEGAHIPQKPKKDQKHDIESNVYAKIALVQLGKAFYTLDLVKVHQKLTFAKKTQRMLLPRDDSWLALSPDASELITYDRQNCSLIRMKQWRDNKNKTDEVLFVVPIEAHIQHGIYINNELLLLAFLTKNSICNIVYDINQNKFYLLPDTIRFQRFLIAGEAKFNDRYVVGGFTSEDVRYSRWLSHKKLSINDSFSCAADAFSLRHFSMNDAVSIDFK